MEQNREHLKTLPPMPDVAPRRPYRDDKPGGYLESDRDFLEKNLDACLWFLEHSDSILDILHKSNEQGN